MKQLYDYLLISNTEVPTEYKVFEQKMLESPDRMGKLYDYLRSKEAVVPPLPRDYVEKITAGFPMTDKMLISTWMSLRQENKTLAGEYTRFKEQMAANDFRLQVYNLLKGNHPDFTASYQEFSTDMGVCQ